MTSIRLVFFAGVLALVSGCTCRRVESSDGDDPVAAKRRAAAEQKRKNLDRARKYGKQQGQPAIARTSVDVWFVDDDRIAAGEDPWVKVERMVGARQPAKNALWVLFKGPTPAEQQKGLRLMKSGSDGFEDFVISGETASLKLRGGCQADGTLTVYDHIRRTLESFPDIEHVKVLDPQGRTQDPDGPVDSRPDCLEP